MEGHESSQLASMLLVSLVISAKGGEGLNELETAVGAGLGGRTNEMGG